MIAAMKCVLKFFKYSIFLLGLLVLLLLARITISRIINNAENVRDSEFEKARIESALEDCGYPRGAKYEVAERFKNGANNRFLKIALDEGELKALGFPKSSSWKKYSELDGGEKQVLDFVLGVQPCKEILSAEDFNSGDFLVLFHMAQIKFNELCYAAAYLYKHPNFYVLERRVK